MTTQNVFFLDIATYFSYKIVNNSYLMLNLLS